MRMFVARFAASEAAVINAKVAKIAKGTKIAISKVDSSRARCQA